MPITAPAAPSGGSDLTAQSVLTDANRLLNDTDSVRWPTAVKVYYLNGAIRELYKRRPDLFLLTGGTMQPIQEITETAANAGFTVPVGYEARTMLVSYVAGWCWAENDDDPRSIEKSKALLETFERLVRE